MNIEPLLAQFRRDVREAFQLPPKSETRLRCESEWAAAANHAGQAFNSAALGLIDGVRLIVALCDACCVWLHRFFGGGK